MSYQDPNQNPNQPGSGQYGGGYVPPQQPQPTDPYSGQQYQQPGGQYQQPGGQYQQPGYQAPYGQQAPYGTPSSGPSSNPLNLEPNVAAGLSYIFWWVSGLFFFVTEKQNRFVRFHAMQSILLTVAMTIIGTILSVITNNMPFGLGCIFGLLSAVVWIGFVVAWVLSIINAFQGKYFKLPIIGDYAEKYANPTTPTAL